MGSLSAAIGKQFNIEKQASLVGDFFGEIGIIPGLRFKVSLFSLESISTSILPSDDCDVIVVVDVVVVVSSEESSASAIFSRSLLSQSYMCTKKIEHYVNKFSNYWSVRNVAKLKKINV